MVAWRMLTGDSSTRPPTSTKASRDHTLLTSSAAVSARAKARGKEQVGSLGSGNHFLELQVVSKVFDTAAADALGLFEGQVGMHTNTMHTIHTMCSIPEMRAHTQRHTDTHGTQVVFMLHSGSRGLGHQVCTDFLGKKRKTSVKHASTTEIFLYSSPTHHSSLISGHGEGNEGSAHQGE